MKLKTSFLALGIMVVVVFAGRAERSSPVANEGAGANPKMMQGSMPGHSMMGNSMNPEDRMNSPLHRQAMSIAALPEMQTELGLSAQQAADLRRLKRDLLAKSKDAGGQIAVRRKELDALLSGDTSRTRTVKALFEKIAELQAQLQYAGFETATRMRTLLSASQKAKFDGMKPMDLHQLVMSRVNMADMESFMQMMGAEDNMGMPHGGATGSIPQASAH